MVKTRKKEKRVRKKKGNKFFKFVKVVTATFFTLLFLLLVAGGLLHLVTRESSEDYIPQDFIAYARIESVAGLFDSVMDLQAAKYILANDSFASFYNLYNSLKSNNLLNSFAGQWLLDVDSSLVLDSKNQIAVVIDMGIRSLATRFVGLIEKLGTIEGLSRSKMVGKAIIYKYSVESQAPIYFSVKNNLVFISPKEDALISLFLTKIKNNSIKNLTSIQTLKKQSIADGMVNFYLRTPTLLEQFVGNNKIVNNILQNVDIGELSMISISLTDFEISVDLTSAFKIGEDGKQLNEIETILNNIVNFKTSKTGVQRLLPENTNFVTSLMFDNFKDFYKLFMYLNDIDYKSKSRQIDSLLKLALGKKSDELFFDWMGQDAGIFILESSMDPVLFINMDNPALQKKVFAQLDKSGFLTSDNSKVIDNIPLGKIGFPDAFVPLLNSISRGLDAPWFVTKDDYLFLSMNGEDLAHIIKSSRNGERLVRDKEYQIAARGLSSNSKLFGYYNMNGGMPGLIKKNSLMWNMLSLYAKGTLAISFDDDFFSLSIKAAGKRDIDPTIYPGYPRILTDGIASALLTENVRGTEADEFIYINKDDELLILDVSFNRYKMQLTKGSEIIPFKKGKQTSLFINNRKGALYLVDGWAKSIEPFPIETGFSNSFSPVVYGDGLLYFSNDEKKLFHINKKGIESSIDNEFEGEVYASPSINGDLIALYPKKFSGEVYIIDKDGGISDGWPQLGGGISLTGPQFIVDRYNHTYITFLTQGGILSFWNLAGESQLGFPLTMGSVFYDKPVTFTQNDGSIALALLDKKGTVYIVSLNGSILLTKEIPTIAGKNSKLFSYDANNDGQDELYIYGDFNYIVGLNSSLLPLKGFPVKAHGRPAFSDLDFDGKEELVTAVYDKDGKYKLFAYYINN